MPGLLALQLTIQVVENAVAGKGRFLSRKVRVRVLQIQGDKYVGRVMLCRRYARDCLGLRDSQTSDGNAAQANSNSLFL